MRTTTALLVLALLGGGVGLAQQGGDTILDATLIGTLPFHTGGVTIGFLNDYDEVCPYGGSTAPDVVYVYVAPRDMTVRITLCDGTNYDSKLYVYEGGYMPGAPLACSDDFCDVASELSEVALTADTAYYIVVDGYGSSSGTYVLDMVELEPAECTDDAVVSQPLVAPDAAVSSDAEVGQYLADNFTLAEDATVCAVRLWGVEAFLNGTVWEECEEPNPAFDVHIYGAGAQMPNYNTVIYAALDVPAAKVETPAGYLGDPIYRYDVELPDCCELQADTEYWIEVVGRGPESPCWFLWLNETAADVGDNRSYWRGAIPPTKLFDLAICLGTGVSCPLVGDVSGDGIVNNFDIGPFVYAITHTEAEFAVRFPDGHYWCANVNGDDIVNNFDIKPFVSLLVEP
jgi:hypothetical protein